MSGRCELPTSALLMPAAGSSGELFFGAVEVSQELLVREGFLQGIEVGPVKVLQKRIKQQGIIVGATNNSWP